MYDTLCAVKSPCIHWYAVLDEILAWPFFGARSTVEQVAKPSENCGMVKAELFLPISVPREFRYSADCRISAESSSVRRIQKIPRNIAEKRENSFSWRLSMCFHSQTNLLVTFEINLQYIVEFSILLDQAGRHSGMV